MDTSLLPNHIHAPDLTCHGLIPSGDAPRNGFVSLTNKPEGLTVKCVLCCSWCLNGFWLILYTPFWYIWSDIVWMQNTPNYYIRRSIWLLIKNFIKSEAVVWYLRTDCHMEEFCCSLSIIFYLNNFSRGILRLSLNADTVPLSSEMVEMLGAP